MGLFFRPRRPLLRVAAGAATAGGIADHTGQRPTRQNVYSEQASTAYPAIPEPPVPATAAMDTTEQLTRLAALHQQGALSDAEFAAAKAQLLGV